MALVDVADDMGMRSALVRKRLMKGVPQERALSPTKLRSKRPFTAGEASPNAKLTWAIVDQIRRDYASGVRQCDIMRKYGLSRGLVHIVVKGHTWDPRARAAQTGTGPRFTGETQ